MITENNFVAITPEDFILYGYKRFEQVKHVKEYADFGLQKLISDEKGKKYYITVFVYDNEKFSQQFYRFKYPNKFSFSPDVQFSCSPCVNVEINFGSGSERCSIKSMEETFEKIWVTLGSPYYELYH